MLCHYACVALDSMSFGYLYLLLYIKCCCALLCQLDTSTHCLLYSAFALLLPFSKPVSLAVLYTLKTYCCTFDALSRYLCRQVNTFLVPVCLSICLSVCLSVCLGAPPRIRFILARLHRRGFALILVSLLYDFSAVSLAAKQKRKY